MAKIYLTKGERAFWSIMLLILVSFIYLTYLPKAPIYFVLIPAAIVIAIFLKLTQYHSSSEEKEVK